MPKPLLFVAVVAAFLTPIALVVAMNLASFTAGPSTSPKQTAGKTTLLYFYSPS